MCPKYGKMSMLDFIWWKWNAECIAYRYGSV